MFQGLVPSNTNLKKRIKDDFKPIQEVRSLQI